MPKYLTGFIVAMAGLSAAGCVSLLPEPAPAPKLYRLLPAPQSDVSAQGSVSKVVQVMSVATSKTLSGQDIIVSYDNETLAAVAEAKWVEILPRLLQNAIADQLNSERQITAVLPADRVDDAYRLQVELREFEARFDQGEKDAPRASVVMTATLTDSKTRALVGRKTFSSTARANAGTISDIVSAQRQSSQTVLSELSNWISNLTTPMRN